MQLGVSAASWGLTAYGKRMAGGSNADDGNEAARPRQAVFLKVLV